MFGVIALKKKMGGEFAPPRVGTESNVYPCGVFSETPEGPVNNIGASETDRPGSNSCIHHLLNVWLWASYWTSLSFSSLICKRRIW